MITPPTNWDTLWADPDSVLEVQLVVNLNNNVSITYTNADLSSCSLDGSLFKDLSIGNACSARLQFVIKDASDVFSAFTQNQKITFKCRLKNGSTSTAYVTQGIYYLDSASIDNNGNVEIVAYDEIYRIANYVSQLSYNSSFNTFMSRLGQMYGLTVNTASLLVTSLSDTTGILSGTQPRVDSIAIKSTSKNTPARKVLETVATLAGGNIAITKQNEMKLFRLDAGPTITTTPSGIVVTATNIFKDERPQVITGVDLSTGSGTFASSSGWRIPGAITDEVCIAGSVDVAITAANNMHTDEKNIRVSNIRVDSAYITPLFEIGDIISVDIGGGQYYNFTLCDYSVDYVGGCWGYLGVPKSSSAVVVSIEEVWDSTHGWIGNFVSMDLGSNTWEPTLEFVNKYQFRLKNIPFNGTNTYKRTMARVASGIETLDLTVRYYGQGGLKTINVTGYLAEPYLPIESSNYHDWEINNVLYYCNELPDDAIGARVSGYPVKLKKPNVIASGYISVTFSASVAGNYHY